MLNYLIVLGQIPGTNIQITFNELLGAFCIGYLMDVYLKYAIEIESWCRWIWYRSGVNYRRQKRHLRSVIRYKLNRLAVFERRLLRQTKSYSRRRRHAIYMRTYYQPYSSLKRNYYIRVVQIERAERRVRRSRPFRTVISWKNFVSQSG